MDISWSASGDTVSVVVAGDIDMATAPLLEAELNAVSAQRPVHVHIDLSAVTFLSRAGIEVLWNARQHSLGSFTILGANPPVRRLLHILQLQQLLQDPIPLVAGLGP